MADKGLSYSRRRTQICRRRRLWVSSRYLQCFAFDQFPILTVFWTRYHKRDYQGYLEFDNLAFTNALMVELPGESVKILYMQDEFKLGTGRWLYLSGSIQSSLFFFNFTYFLDEILDHRPIEKAWNTFSAIGNRFLGGAAEFICILIKSATSNSNAIKTYHITWSIVPVAIHGCGAFVIFIPSFPSKQVKPRFR
jgi:hypothetical protein